jgi:ribosome-associated protein
VDLFLLRQSIHNAALVSYSRSGGPGGQNVNKVNTKVMLRLPVTALAGLSEAEMGRLRETLRNRITEDDELVITASEERFQRTNQERAFSRLEALVAGGARLQKFRRPTKPSRASRENRLKAKRIHSLMKKDRRFPPDPDR